MKPNKKDMKKTEYCINWEGNYNRDFFKKLSKISKQAWRFLKNNFLKKALSGSLSASCGLF